MKKIGIACIVFLLHAWAVSAQSFDIEVLRNTDGGLSRGRMENGQKAGLWVTYDQHSTPRRFEEYKNGVRHGYFVENDEQGHPFMEGWFFEGRPVGKHIVFAHGTLLKEMDFDSSTVKEFYENSVLKKSGKIKDGEPDGKVMQYYETGKVLSENNYVAGKKSGTQKYYYQNGRLQAEYQMVNDMLTGPYKDYHANGQVSSEGMYENNMKQGLWKEYDETGKLVRQVKYKNDVEVK